MRNEPCYTMHEGICASDKTGKEVTCQLNNSGMLVHALHVVTSSPLVFQ